MNYSDTIIDMISDIDEKQNNAINDVETAIWESYCKSIEMYYGCEESLSYIQEASSDESVISKIWSMFKRILHGISSLIHSFISKIKSMITGKKGNKSADQILMEADPNITKIMNKMNHINENETLIKIPAAVNSMFVSSQIKVWTKACILTFDEEDNILLQQIPGELDKETTLKGHGHHAMRRKEGIAYVVHFMKNKQAMRNMTNAVDIIRKMLDKGVTPELYNDATKCFKKFIDNLPTKIDSVGYSSIYGKNTVRSMEKISINDIIEFEKEINNLTIKIAEVPISFLTGDNFSPEQLNTLNKNMVKINNVIKYTQFGLNEISDELKQTKIIDARAVGCIADIEKQINVVDKFINTAITSGMPPKYIYYNTFLMCYNVLKDSKYDPKWGQSRGALFPVGKDYIVKLAVNGVGIGGNKNESEIYDTFKKEDGDYLISEIKKISKSGAVMLVQKCNQDRPSPVQLAAYRASINKFYSKHPEFPYDIRNDLHFDNIRYSDKTKKWVCIDYGDIKRRAIK